MFLKDKILNVQTNENLQIEIWEKQSQEVIIGKKCIREINLKFQLFLVFRELKVTSYV